MDLKLEERGPESNIAFDVVLIYEPYIIGGTPIYIYYFRLTAKHTDPWRRNARVAARNHRSAGRGKDFFFHRQ